MALQARILNRGHGFDPAIEIARHPVSTADQEFGLATVGKPKQTGVFKKAANYTGNADRFANARQSWPQAAHAANDQFDLDPSLRGFVEQGDDRRINQRIHLGPQVATAAIFGMVNLAADPVFHAATQGDRSHEQFAETLLFGETGEIVEQFDQILTKVFVDCE